MIKNIYKQKAIFGIFHCIAHEESITAVKPVRNQGKYRSMLMSNRPITITTEYTVTAPLSCSTSVRMSKEVPVTPFSSSKLV